MLGAGGIGMSAIARFLISKGIRVFGYDKTSTQLTSKLIAEGIDIHFLDEPARIPDDIDLFIYTPAIPKDLMEYKNIINSGVPVLKRAEILGLITKGHNTIAVAGTHGKTTVSSMITYIFIRSGKGCNAFLGGIMKNINSNFSSADNDFFVVEADEFDRSFLQLQPTMAVITSADADHLDIYGDKESLNDAFSEFTSKVISNGTILLKKNTDVKISNEKARVFSYSFSEKADFFADNISITNGYYKFDLITPDCTIKNIKTGVPGKFNAENTVAAASMAFLSGIDEESIRTAVGEFKGIGRRFEVHIQNSGISYIDDYAHHPVELSNAINAVKEMFPSKKITGVFQPHLYTRTRDLACGFAESLDELDQIILLDIYPAREKPIPGVNSEIIRDKMKNKNCVICNREELITTLDQTKLEVLITLGAGDIDLLVGPITNFLISKYPK